MRKDGAFAPFLTPYDLTIMNEYFSWLCEQVMLRDGDEDYSFLFRALHKKEFYWTVPNDDNRAEDGKDLRYEFVEENYISDYDVIKGPCTVLEMLIGLSRRFDDGERVPAEWFWEMLGNLFDLDICTNRVVDPDYLDHILDRFLDRTYDFNGYGGLFPLKNAQKDQRKVEIWYQMQAYIIEKSVTL